VTKGLFCSSVGNLTKLVYLDIHNDFIHGYAYRFAHAYAYTYVYSSDVSWLSSLHSLEHLDMSGVHLRVSADWVRTINTLPNLRVLYLSNCGLDSSAPPLLHNNLTVLEKLHLSHNPFNSPAAPNWYCDVTTLRRLDIYNCELSGPFPDEL
jgi:Leucine-rich repeat (LRR) protein